MSPLLLFALLLAAGGDTAPISAADTAPISAVDPSPIPDPVREAIVSDTFGDPQVRALLERARSARGRHAEGLESFDGRIWERIYLGLDGLTFRRERGVIQEERAGRMRWTAGGDRLVHWEAGRRDIPIAGLSSVDGDSASANEYARSLATGALPPPLAFDPSDDRLMLGGPNEWFLHPLADTAGAHYRYESGDTLRITLPERSEPITLAEVRVVPRRADFRLLSASLWFDEASATIVRGVFRPARPFNLRADAPSGDVPRFIPTIEFEIPVVSVDYAFHEFAWWIPYRFRFEGEGRVGRLARFPLVVEWLVTDLRVNEPEPDDLIPDPLPEGWILSERDRQSEDEEEDASPPLRRIVVVRSGEELVDGAGLQGADYADRVVFSGVEFEELEARLRQIAPSFRPGLQTAWGLAEGLTRYNRVEGFATGAQASLSFPRGAQVLGEIRLGTAAPLPTGGLRVRPGAFLPVVTELGLYRRLVPSADHDAPHGLAASAGTLVFGGGPSPFHYAVGGEAIREWSRPGHDLRLRAFGEWQAAAEKGTDFHLRRLTSSDRPLPDVLSAQEGFWGGAAAAYRWQSGLSPDRPRLSLRTSVEGGGGESGYGRGTLSLAGSVPLGARRAAAMEVVAGGSVGELPLQRHFFPGGPAGYRGGRAGDRIGDTFLLVRSEVGVGRPGARVVLFSDFLRLEGGPPDRVPPLRPEVDDWESAVGAGFSFLDGLIRSDLVRQVRPEGGWRVLFYFDGLF